MRYPLAIGVVVFQVVALAFMAGEREWILRSGRTVLLRTAPIDPNDPMRGDYARLDYEISHVPRHLLDGELRERFSTQPDGRPQPARKVFARLHTGDDGVAELVALTDAKPGDGLFIRGRAQNVYGPNVQVRYGIEALFMQQGTARQLEDMRIRDRPGVPLDIEVAVSPSGTAVLKKHQWEPLGITVEFERSPAPARPNTNEAVAGRPPEVITKVTVELKNHGPQPVAIVDRPRGGSLRLIPDQRWQEPRFRWVGDDREPARADERAVILLEPGQSHKMKIDLTEPEWFVVDVRPGGSRQPLALRDIAEPWAASFRIEYVPPSKADATGLPHADRIRHGRLRSRAFNPTGGVD